MTYVVFILVNVLRGLGPRDPRGRKPWTLRGLTYVVSITGGPTWSCRRVDLRGRSLYTLRGLTYAVISAGGPTWSQPVPHVGWPMWSYITLCGWTYVVATLMRGTCIYIYKYMCVDTYSCSFPFCYSARRRRHGRAARGHAQEVPVFAIKGQVPTGTLCSKIGSETPWSIW